MMRRLFTGIVLTAIIAIFFLCLVVKLAFLTLQLALFLSMLIFCGYIVYIFRETISDIFRGRR